MMTAVSFRELEDVKIFGFNFDNNWSDPRSFLNARRTPCANVPVFEYFTPL